MAIPVGSIDKLEVHIVNSPGAIVNFGDDVSDVRNNSSTAQELTPNDTTDRSTFSVWTKIAEFSKTVSETVTTVFKLGIEKFKKIDIAVAGFILPSLFDKNDVLEQIKIFGINLIH